MSRPHCPLNRTGFSGRFWIFAACVETGLNSWSHVEQHSARPHDPMPPRGLVPGADLPQLDARLEAPRQLADELPEVHPVLGCEVKRHLAAVELPLNVDELHREVHLVDRPSPDQESLRFVLLVLFPLLDVFERDLPDDLRKIRIVIESLRTDAQADELAGHLHRPEVHAPVGGDDHVVAGLQIEPLAVPVKPFPSALEGNLDDVVRHRR